VNGGANWSQVPGFPAVSYEEVKFVTPNKAIILGFYGFMRMSVDGGLNWTTCQSNTTADLFGVSFGNDNTGYAVGSGGVIIKTEDGGFTWQQQVSNTAFTLNSVSFANANTGNACGYGSIILRTTNGGASWYFQSSPVGNTTLETVVMTSPSSGVIVGGGGLILHTTTGGDPIGIEPISSNIPAEYRLGQNYPNPFNPTTIIEFSIPKAGFVNITIYNALGNEIETLVNSNLKAGTYKVDWSATGGAKNYPSGVYFYKLVSGDFVKTKKMLLIK
jgi:hypothetical protein